MRAHPSIGTASLLALALLTAAAGTANAKHGKPWHHFHGRGPVRLLLPRDLEDLSFAPRGEVPAAAIPHAEWCTETYQTYDPDTDTYLRYDGVRVGCNGP